VACIVTNVNNVVVYSRRGLDPVAGGGSPKRRSGHRIEGIQLVVIARADEDPSVINGGRGPLRPRHRSQPQLGAGIGVESKQPAIVECDIQVSVGDRRGRYGSM